MTWQDEVEQSCQDGNEPNCNRVAIPSYSLVPVPVCRSICRLSRALIASLGLVRGENNSVAIISQSLTQFRLAPLRDHTECFANLVGGLLGVFGRVVLCPNLRVPNHRAESPALMLNIHASLTRSTDCNGQ